MAVQTHSLVLSPGDVLQGTLEEHAQKGDDVLVVGCGNSHLSESMAMSGWNPAKIVSVDFSTESIQQAATRSQGSGDSRLAALQYRVADCRVLHELFPVSSFDCAVDKGTIFFKLHVDAVANVILVVRGLRSWAQEISVFACLTLFTFLL